MKEDKPEKISGQVKIEEIVEFLDDNISRCETMVNYHIGNKDLFSAGREQIEQEVFQRVRRKILELGRAGEE